MYLGIPGRIVEIRNEPSGAPDLQIGDCTVARAGFAPTRIDEASARVTIATMAGYGVVCEHGAVPS